MQKLLRFLLFIVFLVTALALGQLANADAESSWEDMGCKGCHVVDHDDFGVSGYTHRELRIKIQDSMPDDNPLDWQHDRAPYRRRAREPYRPSAHSCSCVFNRFGMAFLGRGLPPDQ